MTWTPKNQVLDLTPIVDNLLAFIDTNDEAALIWASGDTLPGFKGLYPNATGRLATLFPQIIVLDQECAVKEGDNTGDLLIGHLALTLEGALTGTSADSLVLTTKSYGTALESMLVNITPLDLTDGANVDISEVICMGYQTAYDQVKGYGKEASSWLQIFQTRVEYTLIAEAFS